MGDLGSAVVRAPTRGQSESAPGPDQEGADREPRGDFNLPARGVVRTAPAGLTDDEQSGHAEADERAGGADEARPPGDHPRPDDEPRNERERREDEGEPEKRAEHETREKQHPWSHLSPSPAAQDSVSVRPGPGAVKAVAHTIARW